MTILLLCLRLYAVAPFSFSLHDYILFIISVLTVNEFIKIDLLYAPLPLALLQFLVALALKFQTSAVVRAEHTPKGAHRCVPACLFVCFL